MLGGVAIPERHTRRDTQQERRERDSRHRLGDDGVERLRIRHRYVSVHLGEYAPDILGQRFRVVGPRAYNDAHFVWWRPEVSARSRHEWIVNRIRRRLIETVGVHVAGDADDAIEWRLRRVGDALAERVLARPEAPRQ